MPSGSPRTPRKPKAPIEITEKTLRMLQDYCQQHGTQIRSEVDGLIQFAIEQRLKERM